MAKKKQVSQEDLKHLFEKAKTSLQQLGKETGTWLKKGEAELSRLSRIGKLELQPIGGGQLLRLAGFGILVEVILRTSDAHCHVAIDGTPFIVDRPCIHLFTAKCGKTLRVVRAPQIDGEANGRSADGWAGWCS